MSAKYLYLLCVVAACSTNGSGLSPQPADMPDALQGPDAEALPCKGLCGSGTTCVNNACTPIPGTGGSQPVVTGTGGRLGTGGSIPLGTGGSTSTSVAVPGTGGHLGVGGSPQVAGAPGTGGSPAPEPQGGPEPGRDGGVDTGRTCGLVGQPCCTGRTCNIGATCSGQGCVSTDGGTSPEVSAPVDTKPACGGANQACCLTQQQAADWTGQGIPHTTIRQSNCPTSYTSGFDCFTVQNADNTFSFLCKPCSEFGQAGHADGCAY